MEMIDFQKDKYPQKLDEIHESILEKLELGEYTTADDLKKSKEVKEIISLTLARTGIKIRLGLDSHLAAVLPFYINEHHVFLREYVRGGVNSPNRQAKIDEWIGRKGVLDRKKAKVSGFFTECESLIFMNYLMLSQLKMTASELTAVFLHELGHVWSVLEYSDRMMTCNQVMADATRRAISDKSEATSTYVYREISKINPKMTKDTLKDLMSEERTIAGPAWAKCFIESMEHQLKDPIYDRTSNETLADNFTARFGYGRQLVSALNKFGGEGSKLLNHPGSIASTMIVLYTLMGFWYGAILGLLVGSGVLFVALTVAGIVIPRIIYNSDSHRDHAYDDPKARYQRIRDQQVQLLKDSKMSDSELKEALETIEDLDDVIRQTVDSKSVWRYVGNFLLSSGAAASRSIEEQQLMERLVSNNLYVRSAQFKTL